MEKEKKVLECIENEGLERRLTLGKHYSVEHTYFDKHNNIIGYHILDDLGVLSHYFPYHFVEYLSSSLSTKDPIVEQVKEMFDKRSEVGIKKYGTTLHDNNTDDFFNHLQEELMDAILYIQKLKEIESKISKLNESEEEECDGCEERKKALKVWIDCFGELISKK